MNDLIFEILKILIMVLALVLTRYIIPFLKEHTDAQQMEMIARWARYAVLSTQQIMGSAPGTERKAVVTEFLKEILRAKKISISDEQLEALIEAAVKQMKLESGS